jgi:branched-chain amino acid transport system permease protein
MTQLEPLQAKQLGSEKSTRALLRPFLIALVLGVLFLMPLYAWLADDIFMLTLFGRILVFALAALGLNIALGFGGMVSLGHAMYLGLGAYAVGILSTFGMTNGWLHLVTAIAITTAVAIPIGWVALRTQGIAFIMITLAFAQLFYYVFVSLRQFGGDDGLSLSDLSAFGTLTGDKYAIYISLSLVLALTLWLVNRLVHSRFGLVLRATCVNERRVNALGTRSAPYRLMAYVLSAQICAVAGFFLANLTGFVSPATMSWVVSGELIVMVLLGGLGTVFGPIIGAVSFLLIEEGLKSLTEHWPLIMGPFIVLVVVFLKNGLWGLLQDRKESAQGNGGSH